MAGRPAPDTRALLLEHGRRLARRSGLRGLTVRGLCKAAGVNPGSFVYHFGTRDRYLAELIEQIYAPLFARIQADFAQVGSPLERLRAMLLDLLRFVADSGALLSQFVMDGFAGERAVVAFLRGLGMRHPQLLLRCIVEAQAAGQLQRVPPDHQLMFLMAATGMPAILQGMIAGRAVLPQLIRTAFARYAADPAAVAQRLDWALQGLRPGHLEPQA
jgi:AcrR family transcriptional regulator